MKIADSVIAVVGGATGLGKALCDALLSKGARVLCIDSDDKAVTAARTAWSAAHKPKSWCGTCVDPSVSDALQVVLTDGLKSPVARASLLHALVFVAPGVNRPANAAAVDDGVFDAAGGAKWRRALENELASVIECTRTGVLTMRSNTPTTPTKNTCEGNGLIINITSLRDFNGDPKRPLASAASAGVVAFTRTLAALAHPSSSASPSIRVNAVCTDVSEEKVAVQNLVSLLEDTKANATALKITTKDGIQPILVDTSGITPATPRSAANSLTERPTTAGASGAASPTGSGAHHKAGTGSGQHPPAHGAGHHSAGSGHHAPAHGSGHHAPPGTHAAGSGVTATGTPAPAGSSGKTREAEEALIVQYLAKSKTIAGYLNDTERVKMAGLFKLQEYKKHDLLFKQGEAGAGAFILHKGSVEIFLASTDAKTGKPTEQIINRYQPGDMFGEQALISVVKRLASVRAAGNSSLWVCSREEFQAKFGHKRVFGTRAGVSAETGGARSTPQAPAAEAKTAPAATAGVPNVSAAAAAAGVGPKPNLPPIPAKPSTGVSSAATNSAAPPPPPAAVRDKKKDERVFEMIGKAVERNLLFLDLTRAQKRAVIAEMWKVNVKAGETVIEQGTAGDIFYVIDQGRFDITVNKMRVAMRNDGECFGELALMYNQPRAATVVAAGTGVLWAIDRATFRTQLAEVNKQQLAQYDQLLKKVEKVELLKSLSIAERQQVVEAIEEFVKPPGTVLMRQGEAKPADGTSFYMYFLIEGRAQCTKLMPDGKTLEVDFEYSPGTYFGELALINDEPRKATIKCTTECLLYGLSAENFRSLVVGDQSTAFGKQLQQNTVAYSPGGTHGAAASTPRSRADAGVNLTIPTGSGSGSAAAAPPVPPSPTSAAAASAAAAAATAHAAQNAAVAAAVAKMDTLSEKNDEPPILYEDLIVKRMLGKGSFGTVKLVIHRQTGKAYALKAVWKRQIVETGQQGHVMSEKKVMTQLKHPFCTRLHATYKDAHRLYFLLEVSLGGELFTVLRARQAFDEATAKFYAATVVLAFEYMHSKDIIYRDLKPENLMMDEAGFLKVTDFGFAKSIPDGRTYTLCGTPDYLAPEIVSGKGHGKGVDWWTLGIFLFEMLASYPPFYDEDPMKTYQKIIAGKIAFPPHFGKEATDLITHLLEPKASKRYGVVKGGADLIKQHAFFRGFDWAALVTKKMVPPIPRPITGVEDTQNFDSTLEIPDEAVGPTTQYNDDGSNWEAAF